MQFPWPERALAWWFRPLRPAEPNTTRLTSQAALAEERAHLMPGVEKAVAGAALCLSGGGIRSAAVSLGVLQALAAAGALTRFHWLSTVSGGGYTGAWLQAWIHNADGDADGVQTALGGRAEPPEVKRLREWCNYLTPQPGLLSGDTWTGVALWIRNVLVNWMVFGPILLAAASAPFVVRQLYSPVGHWAATAMLMLGSVALLFGTVIACTYLPSHIAGVGQPDKIAPDRVAKDMADPPRQLNQQGVGWLIILPTVLWSTLVPCTLNQVTRPALHDARNLAVHDPLSAQLPEFWHLLSPGQVLPAALGFVTMVLGFLVAMLAGGDDVALPSDKRGAQARRRRRQRESFRANIWPWIAACAAGSGGIYFGGTLSAGLTTAQIVVLGPPWIMLSHMLQTMLYVALRQASSRSDLDREWLARVSALKAMIATAWLLFAATVLLAPGLIFHLGRTLGDVDTLWLSVAAPAGAAASGGIAAALGKSARTFGAGILKAARTRLERSLDAMVALATFVFVVCLFASLGSLADVLQAQAPLGGALLVLVVSAGAGAWLAQRVNVNRFSMHATYRNRLSRAFLGAAMRSELRRPEPLTGFDPYDNPRMQDLKPRSAGQAVLLPVITTTLNLASGSRWPERKGRPFTITPLHCGYGAPPPGGSVFVALQARRNAGLAGDWLKAKDPPSTYVKTSLYAGGERETGRADRQRGLTLATAMTLSGAAVSPAMGYHSQPATAFLMTLFDVRLGAWLPNPGLASLEQLRRPQPPSLALLREMLGRTDDGSSAIYLSDGGHFDNLGLYEALRRQPAVIVAVDAANDPTYQYADLAGTLRKALADFDITIDFPPSFKIGEAPAHGWVQADIRYPGAPDRKPGTLIYVKSSKPGALPPALAQFAAAHPDFPHTATTRQFFQETEFESYRALGRLLGQTIAETLALALQRVDPPAAPALAPIASPSLPVPAA